MRQPRRELRRRGLLLSGAASGLGCWQPGARGRWQAGPRGGWRSNRKARVADQPAFAQLRNQLLPRPIASTVVAVSRLVPADGLVEIDVTAPVPET